MSLPVFFFVFFDDGISASFGSFPWRFEKRSLCAVCDKKKREEYCSFPVNGTYAFIKNRTAKLFFPASP